MDNINKQIPKLGFVTLKTIIGCKKEGILPIIPVCKTKWYQGVKSGLFPKPYKIGERLNVWAVEDILALLERLKSQ